MKLTDEQKSTLLSKEIDHEGHAVCVLSLYDGMFRHNDTHGWLRYNGRFWETEGAKQAVERAITNTLQQRRVLFAAIEEMKKANFCSSWRTTITNTMGQMAKHSKVYTPIGRFDNSNDDLNVQNGVVNLRTGKLADHSPDQLFTYCIAVNYSEKQEEPGEWLRFLESTGLSEQMIEFCQIAAGYSLTGHTSEEVMFYLFGATRSGKGTFTEVMNQLLGNLAMGASMETFTSKRYGDTSRFDMAPMKGKRFVTASESTATGKLNAAVIKSITGGDEIYCSFKRKDHFSYRPQFKIWLTSNFPVNMDVDDDAAWGRLRVIKFNNSFLGREDKTLKERLKSKESLERILRWAVLGAMDWYVLKTTGLPLPDEVAAEVDDHRLQLDGIGLYLDEMCDRSDELFVEGKVLHKAYSAWCEDEGNNIAGRKTFTQSLGKKGISAGQKKVGGVNKRGYFGVDFKINTGDDDIPA